MKERKQLDVDKIETPGAQLRKNVSVTRKKIHSWDVAALMLMEDRVG